MINDDTDRLASPLRMGMNVGVQLDGQEAGEWEDAPDLRGELIALPEEVRNPSTTMSFVAGAAVGLAGLILQCIISREIFPLIFGLGFAIGGFGVLCVLRLTDRWGRRAFLLALGMCFLAAGVEQVHDHLIVYGKKAKDPVWFHEEASKGLAAESPGEHIHAPLAITAYRTVYTIAGAVGFGNGAWIGIQFNSLIMAIASVIVIGVARQIVGNEPFYLKRTGTLFAFCGAVWLCGAIFIRDGFILFSVVLTLWALTNLISRQAAWRMLVAVLAFVLAIVIVYGVRQKEVPLFIMLPVVALVAWFRERGSVLRTLFMALASCVLVVAFFSVISTFLGESFDLMARFRMGYSGKAVMEAMEGSLGVKYVIGQPFPIRMVTGSIYMVMFPIPLWADLRLVMGGYYWFLNCNSLFFTAVFPWVLIGMWSGLKSLFRPSGRMGSVLLCVSLFALMAHFAIVATSLEARHISSFMPGWILLAGTADVFGRNRQRLKNTMICWYSLVVLVHVIWVLLKFI